MAVSRIFQAVDDCADVPLALIRHARRAHSRSAHAGASADSARSADSHARVRPAALGGR